ncbi:aromatic ring-hydroxylating dioxygenase subunit alpha [uncultured Pigmentiphaga sp.]|jgi:Phenylpropionate dioxygenase and related ring-hydroxylating dioxygenases, large terminal subunit|uniref:aromatic ring-hydroxylating dioxygenase subunit alpha n=1 Tax=uncultured Pigmentiphaga sp. TaxID=340361 RepID=UPI00262C4C05|nr:aromatic ring-hydroxylating dioxygenase subunit alpha [uncultured Pigmentiphaga sp.]
MNVCDDPVALNDWYVVAYVDELGLGKSEQTQLLGEELELMRERDGRFRCLWHKRDETAEPLEHIRQRYGFVWVSLGRPTRDILTIAEFDDGEPRRFIHRGRIGVPSSAQRVIENFFDLSHFSFVHTGTLGGYDAAEVPPYRVEYREDGRELWAVGCSFFQPKASAAAGLGTQVYYDYRIASPCIAIIYKDSLVRPGKKDLIGLFVQPCGEEHCTVHSFARVFDETNSDEHILHFYHEIFAQDRMILVHQRPRKLPVHPRQEVPAASDASSVAYRRWLDRSGLQFGLERNLT